VFMDVARHLLRGRAPLAVVNEGKLS
jgi:hypothetical protein